MAAAGVEGSAQFECPLSLAQKLRVVEFRRWVLVTTVAVAASAGRKTQSTSIDPSQHATHASERCESREMRAFRAE